MNLNSKSFHPSLLKCSHHSFSQLFLFYFQSKNSLRLPLQTNLNKIKSKIRKHLQYPLTVYGRGQSVPLLPAAAVAVFFDANETTLFRFLFTSHTVHLQTIKLCRCNWEKYTSENPLKGFIIFLVSYPPSSFCLCANKNENENVFAPHLRLTFPQHSIQMELPIILHLWSCVSNLTAEERNILCRDDDHGDDDSLVLVFDNQSKNVSCWIGSRK